MMMRRRRHRLTSNDHALRVCVCVCVSNISKIAFPHSLAKLVHKRNRTTQKSWHLRVCRIMDFPKIVFINIFVGKDLWFDMTTKNRKSINSSKIFTPLPEKSHHHRCMTVHTMLQSAILDLSETLRAIHVEGRWVLCIVLIFLCLSRAPPQGNSEYPIRGTHTHILTHRQVVVSELQPQSEVSTFQKLCCAMFAGWLDWRLTG